MPTPRATSSPRSAASRNRASADATRASNRSTNTPRRRRSGSRSSPRPRQVDVRRARVDEVAHVRALRLRALATDPDAFGETLDRALARSEADYIDWIGAPERGMFVASDADGRLIGMAVGAPAPVEDRPKTAALFAMWVAPEA